MHATFIGEGRTNDKNLYTFLKHKYGEEVDLYFAEMAKQEAEGDKWDSDNNRIICATDEFIEEEEVDDIGLGAKAFLENQKAQIEVAKGVVA